jgi:pyrroline-5-carboxylate reductase
LSDNTRIGFIGAGNMAGALIRGLVHTGVQADNIWASSPEEAALKELSASLNIHTTTSNIELAGAAEVLVLAVKPQVLPEVCREIAAHLPPTTLVISVAAGVACEQIQKYLSEDLQPARGRAIVRCMPNTPAQIQLGASGLFANAQVSAQQKALAQAIMAAVGVTRWLNDEALIDVVTALAGSGPAYFYAFMEALIEAACAEGLDRDSAVELTTQTALGAASLARQTAEPLATLRERVTSPKGTTEYALRALAEHQLDQVVAEGVKAALERARELAAAAGQ